MTKPINSRFKKTFHKIVNKETLLYGIFGIITSILNIFLFNALVLWGLDYKFANFITLIVVKLSAYICNKNFVFCSKCANMSELVKEFGRFLVARGATMLIDYLGLIVLVEIFSTNKFITKCFITIFVIVINYFTGKKHVFKGHELQGEQSE